MEARTGPDLELLLAHSAWIRALARRLVGEGADDLVQETWVAALARPELELRSPRAWLAGVLRRLARQTRRKDSRRRAREERSARESAAACEPSVAETFEAAATGRALADLVLALEEPFRSVVLLRYYEDLPPQRIAARLGVPVRTVNSRLERGVARLRERWQLRERAAGRDGDAWARALFLLAGRPSSLAPAAPLVGAGTVVPLGVALMNAKIVLGAVLVGGGAVAWWLSSLDGKEGASAAAPARAELAQPATELASTPALAEAPVQARTESPAEPRTPLAPHASDQPLPALAAAALRTLHGRVLDAEARPLPGIEVAYRAHEDHDAQRVARSGVNGAFELEVPRGIGGDLEATDPELVTVMRGRVNERTEVSPLIVVAPRLALAGIVQDELGAPLGEVRVSYRHPPGFRARFEAVLDATDFSEWSGLTHEDGRFELARVPRIEGAELVAELEGFAPWSGALPWQDDRRLVLTLARKTSELAAVSGVVLDPEGRPVPGAWVSLGARSTATDAAGEFRLERADALEASELRALKAGYRLARLAAGMGPDGKPAWPEYVELTLGGMPLALAGRVLGKDGKPRPDLSLWLADPTPFGVLMDDMLASAEFYLADAKDGGDAYFSSREADAEGRFRLDGLLERDYSVRVMSSRTLAIATFGPFHAGDLGVEIVFDDGPLGRIEGRVLARDGRGLADVAVHLMGNSYGGIWSGAGETRSDAEGRFVFTGVGGERLQLAASGDDIVPLWSPVDAPRGGTVKAELTVAVRCHFQVDLGTQADRADQLRVLDGDGNPLPAYRIDPTGTLCMDEFPIVAGRSDALGVDERAATLVLLKNGAEVQRVPLALRRGELARITP